MIIKTISKLKNKSFNNTIIRLQRKGCNSYPIFHIIAINKKSRSAKGKVLDTLGSYNPNFFEKSLFFDSIKLYHWILRGIIIHYQVKYYITKFIIAS